ncbi:hypothetical protein HDE_13538 [Halotydeus destructor]|nr:hypothetical protein HDE_13538 [Halotydeus destructor]
MYSYTMCLSFWYNTTIVLYGYVLYLILLVEEAYFEHYCKSLDTITAQRMFNLCALKSFYTNSIVKIWSSFEALFNPMPVMWTSYIFVTCSAIIAISKNYEPNRFDFNEYLSFVAYFLITVAVILFVSSCVDKMKALKIEHSDRLTGTQADALIVVWDRHLISLTGMNIFSIDRPLLLSFAGSLISFSILFASLDRAGKSE